jgi:hypothetical protein
MAEIVPVRASAKELNDHFIQIRSRAVLDKPTRPLGSLGVGREYLPTVLWSEAGLYLVQNKMAQFPLFCCRVERSSPGNRPCSLQSLGSLNPDGRKVMDRIRVTPSWTASGLPGDTVDTRGSVPQWPVYCPVRGLALTSGS